MNMFFVAGVVVWVMGAALSILATRKQIEVNPGRRIAHLYGRQHADPFQVRLMRAGGSVLLMLSALLFIQLWGFAGLIPMVTGAVPAVVLTTQHNNSVRD